MNYYKVIGLFYNCVMEDWEISSSYEEEWGLNDDWVDGCPISKYTTCLIGIWARSRKDACDIASSLDF